MKMNAVGGKAVRDNLKAMCSAAASGVVALTLAAASPAAHADGIFLGGGGGRTISHGICDLDGVCTEDDGSTAVMAFGGYRFGKMLAVEGAYLDIGEVDENGTDSVLGNAQASLSSKGIAVSGLLYMPFWEELEFFGRLGGYFSKNQIEGTSTATGPVSEDESGAQLLVGAGAQANMGEVIALRFEWQGIYNVEDINFNVLTGSLVLRF
jgi:hypothetical protein